MTDKRDDYSYHLQFSERGGFWQIVECDHKTSHTDWPVVWETPYEPTKDDPLDPPKVVREKYEELIGYEKAPNELFINLVELFACEDGGFDQPCIYGNRVESHAVYCHNQDWLYAPRKCHRTWYTGGKERDEDCEGYKPNPAFKRLEK